MRPLVRLEHTYLALGDKTILKDISWRLDPGSHWVVLGPNGAGKSSFLRLVRGELWPLANEKSRRVYNLDGTESVSPAGIRSRIGLVSAEFQELYLRREWRINAESVVLSGLYDAPLLYREPDQEERKRVRTLMAQLGLSELTHRPFTTLSQGEARLVLLARALAPNPLVLILDEVLEGLDIPARARVLDATNIAAHSASLLFATHRPEELPACITHAALFRDGRMERQGKKTDILFPARTSSPPPGKTFLPGSRRASSTTSGTSGASGGPRIRITNADVYLEGTKVLHNLSWQLEPKENWAVLGGNGAGKTTLLELLLGRHHPASGGSISRLSRDGATSVRDWASRFGYVSSRFQAQFGSNLNRRITLEESVLSGFFGSVGLFDQTTPGQRAEARDWLDFVGLGERKWASTFTPSPTVSCGGCFWPEPWRATRSCSCWTNPAPGWTSRRGGCFWTP